MSDQYVGEIRIFGFNFAPIDWAACDGQILPIQQNTLLFSIIGNRYGGNGSTTFALPNLQGRAALCTANSFDVGDMDGEALVQLTYNEMPAHTHTAYADVGRSTATVASANILGRFQESNGKSYIPAVPAPAMTQLAPQTLAPVGSGGAHENRQPYQIFNYCIALQGNFPPHP